MSSNVTLQSSVSYFIKALGTYSITASRQADANWYQESGTLNWVKASDVRVSCGVADWDEYRETLPGQDVTAPEADSEYGGFITGGDAPLDASILDRYYPDNRGWLTLEVYKDLRLEPTADLDLNFDGDTDDSVDGVDNYRPGYLVDGTQVLSADVDQDFNIIAKGLPAHATVEFALEGVTSYTGRAGNLGSETGPDIVLGAVSVEVDSQGQAIMNAKNKDYAGTAKIKIKLVGVTVFELDLSKDDDADGLPNWWENQYGGNQNANSDDDKNKSGVNGAAAGDLLPAFDEFRGFMVSDGGNAHHVRTDPTVKDAFLKDLTGYATTDGAGDALSWTERLDLNTHRVVDGQHDGQRKINANGANSQRAIFVEDAQLNGPWGETAPGGHNGATTPSQYTGVHVDIAKHRQFVEFLRTIAIPNSNNVNILYRGSSDPHPSENWLDGGKVKVGNEVITYERALPPMTADAGQRTAGPAVPAASGTIIVDTLPNGLDYRHVLIGNEVIDVSPNNVVNKTLEGNGAVVAAGNNTIDVNLPAVPPAQGGDYYVRITSAAAGNPVEWISYGNAQPGNGFVRLSNLQRGLFGTNPIAIAANDAVYIPKQYSGVARGQFNTQAAQINGNTSIIPVGVLTNAVRGAQPGNLQADDHIAYFSKVDDAIRNAVAHEVGHALGLADLQASIMQGFKNRGAFAGNNGGLFDDYDAQQMSDKLDAR